VNEEIRDANKNTFEIDLRKEMDELRWRQPDGRPVNLDLFVDFKSFHGVNRFVEFELPKVYLFTL
jgi:hypothetical protein